MPVQGQQNECQDMLKRTQSQPAGHWAISDCAHTPEIKSEAIGTTPERNLENMAGGDKVDEGVGRGEEGRGVGQGSLKQKGTSFCAVKHRRDSRKNHACRPGGWMERNRRPYRIGGACVTGILSNHSSEYLYEISRIIAYTGLARLISPPSAPAIGCSSDQEEYPRSNSRRPPCARHYSKLHFDRPFRIE